MGIDLKEGERARLTLRLHEGCSMTSYSSSSTGLVSRVELDDLCLHPPNFPTRRQAQGAELAQFSYRTAVSGILPAFLF